MEKTKKYLQKRKQLIDIIMAVPVWYQETDGDFLFDRYTNVDFWVARTMAEQILGKMGISKPAEITEQETSGYALG